MDKGRPGFRQVNSIINPQGSTKPPGVPGSAFVLDVPRNPVCVHFGLLMDPSVWVLSSGGKPSGGAGEEGFIPGLTRKPIFVVIGQGLAQVLGFGMHYEGGPI